MAADTATALLALPGEDVQGALEPSASVLPYSTSHLLTSTPLGSTLPLRLAEPLSTAEEPSVTTSGGSTNTHAAPMWCLPSFVPSFAGAPTNATPPLADSDTPAPNRAPSSPSCSLPVSFEVCSTQAAPSRANANAAPWPASLPWPPTIAGL